MQKKVDMDNIEYIEGYFKGNHDAAQKKDFEKKILEDALFAEEVAFYISANGVIQEQLQKEKKQRFREIYEQQKVISIKQPVTSIWKYLAAACVIVAVLLTTWFFSSAKNSPRQLADTYLQQNWQTLPVTMGKPDVLQTGIQFFNSGNLPGALNVFESLVKTNPENNAAEKYAGIVSLRLGDYDKALKYFTMLEADTNLYSNPGKFYKAITLMERNKSGDEDAARLLLKQVKDGNLEGKTEAAEWLKKF
ncbi:MAG: hypothetical protein ABI472_02220 [Ginsengibacter sp.]